MIAKESHRLSLTTAFLALLAQPVAADDGGLSQGWDLLSDGTKLFLEGLLDEMEPAMRGLKEALDGLDTYEAPEVLPNGDIIIRRRTPQPLSQPLEDGGQVDI